MPRQRKEDTVTKIDNIGYCYMQWKMFVTLSEDEEAVIRRLNPNGMCKESGKRYSSYFCIETGEEFGDINALYNHILKDRDIAKGSIYRAVESGKAINGYHYEKIED